MRSPARSRSLTHSAVQSYRPSGRLSLYLPKGVRRYLGAGSASFGLMPAPRLILAAFMLFLRAGFDRDRKLFDRRKRQAHL
jgi:hypothetical protein